ncbi:class I SAM-dependent methyltransferase [Acidimangrovimonas sediminis]|uniref:class I SAM-dependent methyltransferase n=1 Tax=Acidimangrovimonas sediminis TaxID=2056283 RepID=UPI0011AF5426|nr:class I SAM-dependent methyltransferase [Acidimangrovimonas sediminis]
MRTDVQSGAYQPRTISRQPKSSRKSKTDWTAYAAAYDLLSDYNPAYQELLEEFEGTLSGMDTPRLIYDIGGGTGNYSEIAARKFPESSVYLVEPDPGMTQRAREKLSAYDNVTYLDSPFQEFDPPAPADLVICVHSLYAMPDPESRLFDLRKLLRPGGTLFLIDLGRKLNIAEWRSYLFSHLTREVGIAKAIQIFWNGREIAKQNKAISKAQEEGAYWTHSESELAAAVEKAGFEVMTRKPAYRGYSDLLVCRAAS